MKKGYFVCIIGTFYYFKDNIINRIHQQTADEVIFHFIHQIIKVSEKRFTMFAMKRILELISLHLYVQSINNLLYNVDKVSLKK